MRKRLIFAMLVMGFSGIVAQILLLGGCYEILTFNPSLTVVL